MMRDALSLHSLFANGDRAPSCASESARGSALVFGLSFPARSTLWSYHATKKLKEVVPESTLPFEYHFIGI